MKKYYYAGATREALRRCGGETCGEAIYLHGDHLGSVSLATDQSGNLVSQARFTPYGQVRWSGETVMPTKFSYTGQRSEDYIKLIQMGSRWYDSSLGRFIQPDQIIPEAYNTLAYDRYQYAYSNPVRYTDSSGHCIDGITTWVCILIIGGFVLKAVDYGWTAYDAYQSSRVLSDPNASREDKILAGLNIGLAALFEAAEPDDLLPAGLPLDDAARKAVMKGAKEAFKEGGEEALEKFIKNSLGDFSDEVLVKWGFLNPDPKKLHHIFDKPGRQLGALLDKFGSQEATYNAVFKEFVEVARNYTNTELNRGISIVVDGITVTVRGEILKNGALKLGTFFIP